MTRERRAIFLTVLMALFVFATTTTSNPPASAAPTWTARANDANRKWIALFASDDGTKIIGTVENGTLMRSVDSGATWTAVTALGNRNWMSVFGTPDGQKVMATVGRGPVFISNDFGATWTQVTAVGSRWWSDGAMSSDGQQITFVGNADVPNGDPDIGYIYRSTDGGTTWTLTNMARYPGAATMSRDGRYRAFGEYSLNLYTSSDYGATWTMRDAGVNRYYTDLSSSDSGQYMYAATLYHKIMRSTDYGETWTIVAALPSQTYRTVRTSANGQRVIASAQNGFVYASNDYGVTWTSSWDDVRRNWFAAAMTRDGATVFAAQYDGYFYDRDFFAATVSAPASITVAPTSGQRKSIDVSWQAVANVGSYTVKLYNSAGTGTLKTITGISPSATSYTVTTADYASLADNTSYRVSVTAVAAATQYGGVTETSKELVTTAPVPTTTTTTATTTTTTTTAPATTTTELTVAPTTTEVPTIAASVTTVATGQKDIAAVSPTSVAQNAASTSTSSTTIAPLVSANSGASSAEVSAPEAPSVSPGEAGALVDGELVEGSVTRENNALVASVGAITATITGVSPDGQRISLDSDGNLRLEENDFIQVEAEGYESGESVDVWMYSTPTRIGTATASAEGKISARFELPKNLEAGNHRVVLNGLNKEGTPVILGIGLKFGAQQTTSTTTRVLIAVPIALAVAAGFILPTTVRRRRRAAA